MVRNVNNNAVPVFVIAVNEGMHEEDTTLVTYYEHYYFDSMKTLIAEVMAGLAEIHQDPSDPLPDYPTALQIHDLINNVFSPQPLVNFLFSDSYEVLITGHQIVADIEKPDQHPGELY